MENLRYIIVSYLYIAILLLFRGLRYNLSAKNVNQNLPRGKWLFWGKRWYFNEKLQKNGKSKIHTYICNSFLLIHCNIII